MVPKLAAVCSLLVGPWGGHTQVGLGLDGGATEMLIKNNKTQPSLRVHGPGSEE